MLENIYARIVPTQIAWCMIPSGKTEFSSATETLTRLLIPCQMAVRQIRTRNGSPLRLGKVASRSVIHFLARTSWAAISKSHITMVFADGGKSICTAALRTGGHKCELSRWIKCNKGNSKNGNKREILEIVRDRKCSLVISVWEESSGLEKALWSFEDNSDKGNQKPEKIRRTWVFF